MSDRPQPDDLIAHAKAALKGGRPRDAVRLLDRASALLADPRRVDTAVWRAIAAHYPSVTPILTGVLEALEPYRGSAFVSNGLATWHKILPFLDDARFRTLAHVHAGLLPIPNWQWNLQTVLWAAQQALAVEGDFVELGVFRGHTSLFVAEYLDFAAQSRTWRLYDTFDGIPDDQLDPGWAERNERAYRGGTFSFDEVRERFAHIPNIRVIQGRVPEVLHEDGPERIAFLHVDLNNATAEIAALDLLFDRISPSGVVVFDDYCWEPSRTSTTPKRHGSPRAACMSCPCRRARASSSSDRQTPQTRRPDDAPRRPA